MRRPRSKKNSASDAELVEGAAANSPSWVGDRKAAQNRWFRFPSDQTITTAVRDAING